MNPLLIVVMVVGLGGIVALNIWQQKKIRKKGQEVVATLEVGSKLFTIGGIFGEVVELDEKENTMVIATGKDGETLIKLTKNAVHSIVPKEQLENEIIKEEISYDEEI